MNQYVKVENNKVTFTLQDGPIKEFGVNGCQIDAMLAYARMVLESYNRAIPCRENALAITSIEVAEMWLDRRTRNRMVRGVEGTSGV